MEEKKSPTVFDTPTNANLLDQVCPSCLSKGMTLFYKIGNVPVHSVMNIKSREDASNFPKGNISLGFCKNCGFISNIDFDPDLIGYSSDCEESQGYSATFNAFLNKTATDLIEKYNLYSKDIVEIGCGKGEFLRLLCRLGKNRGIGFDPAYDPGRDQDEENKGITFIKDYYSEKYANHQGDIICCRMTLEHIKETCKLVRTVRRSIGERKNTVVFFQVPDVTRILKECAFEDIYYEHCSYFSPGSLAYLFRSCGFEILDLQTVYDGQYIIIEAKPASGKDNTPYLPLEDDLKTLKKYVDSFPGKCLDVVKYWMKIIRKNSDRRIVLWGSGSKGVAFLTRLKIYDQIQYVVDINPYRQGTYMAGTGQKVVAPGFLKKYKPDIVIVMNPIYYNEIKQDLNHMGLEPEIMALGKS